MEQSFTVNLSREEIEGLIALLEKKLQGSATYNLPSRLVLDRTLYRLRNTFYFGQDYDQPR
jgi:hypothetical protein